MFSWRFSCLSLNSAIFGDEVGILVVRAPVCAVNQRLSINMLWINEQWGNWPGGRECGCWEAVKKKSYYFQVLPSVSSAQKAVIPLTATIKIYVFADNQIGCSHFPYDVRF